MAYQPRKSKVGNTCLTAVRSAQKRADARSVARGGYVGGVEAELTLIPASDEVGVVEAGFGVDDEFERVDDFEFAAALGPEEGADDDWLVWAVVRCCLDARPGEMLADAEDRERMPAHSPRSSARCRRSGQPGDAQGDFEAFCAGHDCAASLI